MTSDVNANGKLITLTNSEDYIQENGLHPDSALFTMSRVFINKSGDFAASIDTAIKGIPEVKEWLLTINSMILNKEFNNSPESREELIETIYSVFDDEDLIGLIFDFIEDSYDIDIEASKDGTPAAQNSLNIQFSNVIAKRVLASAFMQRITYPLLCNFMWCHEIRKDEPLLLEGADRIFKYFNYDDEGEPIDIAGKIQKFTQVQVDNTIYSDRVIWKYLTNMSIGPLTLGRDICRDLITNIIPKLEDNRSVVSFFHVVIKHKCDYQFTSKFKLSYKPITRINTDDDEVNPFIRIEQKLLASNSELNNIMLAADVKNFINSNCNLSEGDIIYHTNNIEVHSAQTKILGFFLSRHIGKGFPIMSLSKKEYVQVLFIAKEWFETNGYNFISFILLGKASNSAVRKRSLTRGKALLEITESSVFTNIMDNYKSMGEKITPNTVLEFVAEIVNTDFEFYQFEDGSYYQTSPATMKNVVAELLTFVESL